MKDLPANLLKVIILTITSTLVFSSISIGQTNASDLESGFKDPPPSAQPRTWWHWTRGNITHEGITKDLEWMKRVGIGGFQLADVNFGSGQAVDEKIEFGSPEWLAAVEHTAREAERLDLEMTLFSSAGWSLAGGPWVKPEEAMKKLVWSETQLQGPQNYSGTLPMPPTEIGLIRNMWRGSRPTTDPEYYGDYAVIAYPTPGSELASGVLSPQILVNGKAVEGSALLDDDLNSTLFFPVDTTTGNIIIEFNYPMPVSIRSASIAARAGIPYGKLSVSNDREDYQLITSLPGPQLYRPGKVRTYAFPEQQAQYFRLEITAAPPSPAQVMIQPQPDTLKDGIELQELKLHSGARVHRWEDKAGFSFLFDYSSVPSPEVPAGAAIDPEKIIDLTAKMDTNGQLHWEVPAGNWTILRTGYSLTGAKNRPAVPAGLGLEVDKLSKEHVLSYIQQYLDPIKAQLGPLYGKSLQYILLDSWEAGMQNWTEKMPEEFLQRRGYSLLPYLPVLSGRIVGNAETSDRFLWDFRRTLADLFAENFYSVMTEYMHKQGLNTYSEASGVSLEILEDVLLCKKYVDIPMCEFWVRDLHPSAMYHVDVRGAASAAHAYGKTFVGAEAFTGGGYESPQTLKRVSDYWFTQGVNRLVFHTSAHQPLDTKPGNTMVGTHLHRNITWAEQAAPFMTYLSRNAYLLQQGKFVADIAYLLKEGAPSTMPFWGAGLNPPPPEGYDYDYVNADILINRMTVDNQGRIVIPDGMSYRILVLPISGTMRLETLQKLHKLVNDGATILGPKPSNPPGLEGFPQTLPVFDQLTNELWGDLDGISRTKQYFGKGRVFWGEQPADVLNAIGVQQDVIHSRSLNTKISWIHRQVSNTDIYFISSQSDQIETLDFSFRINGRQPELWFSENGRIESVSYKMKGDRTVVPIRFDPYGSVFVIFRKDTEEKELYLPESIELVVSEITVPWTVNFPARWGAPETVTFPKLKSWTTSPEPGISYFSGTASYHNQLKINEGQLAKGHQLWLDLGEVKDLATVYVNGKQAGLFWKQPYSVNITDLVQAGNNQLRIDVTNQWTNRLAGDQDLPEDQRVLDSFITRFGKAWETETSGLLGPVRLMEKWLETGK
ncbi:MAG: glycosyl hydrolase [Saprospiraceae bacterium]